MKTSNLKIKGSWLDVLNDCRFTVGKPDTEREPSSVWKEKILISEHSPIRGISVRWDWAGVKYWVSTHWVRHKWEKFVRTQRTDRTGVCRDKLPQDTPVDFRGEANVQALIDTCRKRLCFCASPETRQMTEDLKLALWTVEPEIADVLVPNCVYRGGCPEVMQNPSRKCRFYQNACASYPDMSSADIRQRYDAYNALFYKSHEMEVAPDEERKEADNGSEEIPQF